MKDVIKRLKWVDSPDREWNGNNDHVSRVYFGRILLSQSPVVLRLNWKESAHARAEHVGDFRIDLEACLREGLVYTPVNAPGYVVLRFQYSDGGIISISRRRSGPSIPIGRVNF